MAAGAEAGLARAAEAVLRANDAGRWTRPAPALYPHQWNWDSAFAAIGWATFDWERAALEVISMLEAAWREGMVPHLRYDPRFLSDYFPGPDRWPGAQAHVARPGVSTSGITNPPVLALAALAVGLRQPDRERRRAFWSACLPGLAGFVRYLGSARRLPGSPLVACVHPWETGWDNSPRWDGLGQGGLRPARPYRRLDTAHVTAEQRPGDRDYDAYLALAELLDACDYDLARYRERSPFVVHDVLVDALWHRAAVAVNRMAGELGQPGPVAEGELAEFAVAFEQHHWDPGLGMYVDWDCVAGRRIERPSAAGVAALAGGFQDRERARSTWEAYAALQGELVRLCTVPPGDPAFQPSGYWRGPVWVSVNWLAIEGLEAFGMGVEARVLREETLGLVAGSGFAEYFDPRDGSGCGSAGFSWTAALTLDLLAREAS